jgi:sugar phosphate isomerase/epimerase
MNRRELLRNFGGAVGGSLLTAFLPQACTRQREATSRGRMLDRIGVQLYTVRSLMDAARGPRSVEETLDQVARIGYREVEFAGYYGRTPQQIKAALDASGLTAPATHVMLSAELEGWDQTLEAAGVIGHGYVIVPWIAVEERTLNGYRRVAQRFNRAAERARAAGVVFGYHNHDFEFQTVDGQIAYDVLLAETDPELVKMELDLFWIRKGGQDPVAYFERHPGRFHTVHVKDMDREGKMVDVGKGTIDFAAIFRHMDQAGIRHFFVEHDSPADPFDSIRASYEHLSQLTF